MVTAYSRLNDILDARSLTVPELHRRMLDQSIDVNIKTLYRLKDAHQPVSRLDLRIAGAICQLCEVTLSELVDFADEPRHKTLDTEIQQRLDELMEKNNNGTLGKRERRELERLVHETQKVTLHNARVLADHKRRLEQ